MATCMAIGQGAGVAAAQAVAGDLTTRAVDSEFVRERLPAQGQYLHNAGADEVADSRLILHRAGGSGETASHFNPFIKRQTNQ